MEKRASLDIIQEFLLENSINISLRNYLKDYLVSTEDCEALPDDIIIKIIGDAYDSSSNLVKKIANELQIKLGFFIGRIQKNQLKKYIDYRLNEDFEIFINLIKQELEKDINLKEICDKIITESEYSPSKSVSLYINNLKKAVEENNTKRIKDYLIFLYSRLISINEKRKLSLKGIFLDNERIEKKELTMEAYTELKELCSDSNLIDRTQAISKFNREYIRILQHNGGYKDKNSVIYLYLNQETYNKFASKINFYNYAFNLIKRMYGRLQNHKTFIIQVGNILDNEKINIKWEIYSYLTIFAEKFKKMNEFRPYYKPEELCRDFLEHRYKIKLSDTEFRDLSSYFMGKLHIGSLNLNQKYSIPQKDIDFFKEVYNGFSFIDCFILKTKETQINSKEVTFIQNNNELLLIFSKHETDDRKIPCPVCGSLKISGNSYPEVGIKSWECKNPLCSGRSKTNRGKRYSDRTILMQDATFDFSSENQISKEIIKLWRKDIVESWNLRELYRMIIKYFSYVNDTLLIINAEDTELFKEEASSSKRQIYSIEFNQLLEITNDEEEFKEFMDRNPFFEKFLYKNIIPQIDLDISKIYNNSKAKFVLGDSLYILDKLKDSSIHNMVTSPPYYNAREYSQWQNLYNYLNDMYNIILKSNEKLTQGGVFFYNIGDIFDNDNTIVKSKMGEKRIPLGAYIILLFQKAGFEILDNIIWYKGEPQSNRHKNDGNYTPYYQRPANCYEHMFIFKKKGNLNLNKNNKENILNSNIIKFTPVFKIFKGGENRYGHTAPFPHKIPLLSALCFTNEGEYVLDPFSGSGTSPIVANKNKRIGIGIELNKDYFELALSKAKEENVEYEIIK